MPFEHVANTDNPLEQLCDLGRRDVMRVFVFNEVFPDCDDRFPDPVKVQLLEVQ